LRARVGPRCSASAAGESEAVATFANALFLRAALGERGRHKRQGNHGLEWVVEINYRVAGREEIQRRRNHCELT